MTDLVDSFFTDLNRQVGWPEGSISWLVLKLGCTLEWCRELPANTSVQADARDFNPASLEWDLDVSPSENLPGSRMRGARIENGCSGPSSRRGKSLPPLGRCLCHMRWAVAELCAGTRGLAPTLFDGHLVFLVKKVICRCSCLARRGQSHWLIGLLRVGSRCSCLGQQQSHWDADNRTERRMRWKEQLGCLLKLQDAS